ncbi:MAG: histidine phosphatase family protein [Magnetococcales bacterium]|nr:histidine phosphatase family protein [Magnetococcales bacterium]
MTDPLLIDLLRHGEVTGGARFNGKSDPPLTEAGWKTMERAAALSDKADGLLSSPLERCSVFAQWWGKKNGIPVVLDAAWREYDFGLWDGRTSAEVMAMDPLGLAAFWDDPTLHPPPGGEPMDLFAERISGCLHSLTTSSSPEFPAPEHLLVITHGGVMRQLAALALGRSFRDIWSLNLPPGACVRLVLDRGDEPVSSRSLFLGVR